MLFTPDDPEFAACEAQHRWFEHVLLATWNEIEVPDEIPVALDWLAIVPPGTDLDIEEVECSLAYVGESGYTATIWDASGVEDDLPWAVFLVDDFGVRFLSEYSLFEGEDELPDAALEEILALAEAELPDRMIAGEFDRELERLTIPEWLAQPTFLEEPK